MNTSTRVVIPGIIGGIIWLLLWVFFLLTHGPGPENRREFFLSLTWIDYSKFIVVPLALFGWCLVALQVRQRERSGWPGMLGLAIALAGFAILILSLVVNRWTVPWGLYIGMETHMRVWGLLINLSTLPILVGSWLFAFAVAKARVWPRWLAVPLVVGALAIFPWLHETIYGMLYGISWLVIGAGILANQPATSELP